MVDGQWLMSDISHTPILPHAANGDPATFPDPLVQLYDMDRIYLAGAFTAIAIILLILATVGMIGYVIYYYVIAGLLVSTKSAVAVVMRKHQREHEFGSISQATPLITILINKLRGMDETPIYTSNDYFVIFLLLGKEQEFSVPEWVYVDATPGDSGLLTFKGNLFKRFTIGVDGWGPDADVFIKKL